MPVILSTPHATEQSTYAVLVSFFDELGAPATPNAGLAWTLTDLRGAVINSRSAVTITPGTTVTIVLHGADLALSDPADNTRLIKVAGTYNSTLGSNLEIKEQVEFVIDNLVAVP